MGAHADDQLLADSVRVDAGRRETTQPSEPCVKCGAPKRVRGRDICPACRRESQLADRRDLYRERRAEAVRLLGGACVVCGRTDRVHIVRKAKDGRHRGSPAKYFVGFYETMLHELKSCVLMCPSHQHQEVKGSIPHGGGLAGKHHCKCEPCKQRKREYTAARAKSVAYS